MNNPLSPVLNPGNVIGARLSNQKLWIQTQHAFVLLEACSETMIRVRIDKQDFGRDFSYAVVGQSQHCSIDFSEDDKQMVFATVSVKVVVQKAPFSIAFYTQDNQLINADDPALNTSWIGDKVTTYKTMQEGERFIGLGEKIGNLDRKGNGYTHWNSDSFGYGTDKDPLYSTIPFYIGLHHHLSYGIFFDNTYRSDFNFGASNNRFASFGAHGGEMNYYFFYGENVAAVLKDYTALTGRMDMPPLWSLGYQQNRFSYYPDTEVLRIAKTLREKKIPADGITLDIHHMEDYKLFTWDKERFPNPPVMNKKLKEMGFKTTVIVDPGLKVEEGYEAYEEGKEEDIYLKYPDGTPWTAGVWPGWCNFPDFTSPKARSWWKKQMTFFKDSGISGIWNDMNEPASWGHKAPDNVLFDFDGQPATMLQAHNVYGSEMARVSYEGIKETFSNRPFMLTRAAYAGVQRYAALWTGDNCSEEEHLLLGIRLLTGLGLSGVSFTGMDVGGFTDNASVELYARWIQLGAFFPYFRSHTNINTNSAEPWTFGEAVTEIARNFIGLRYRLLPYLYAAFYESTQNGLPVMRSLAINYAFEDKIFDPRYQNEFLCGSSILVCPFRGDAQFGEAYFPEGKWYDFFTDTVRNGGEEKILKLHFSRLPVYVKGSSIIPMQSLVQSTTEKPEDTLYLHIYRGEENHRFVYYEDDGESYDYQEGAFYKREMCYDAENKMIRLGKVEGHFTSKFQKIKLLLHGFTSEKWKVNGKRIQADTALVSFIEPISHFDPHETPNPRIEVRVWSYTIEHDRNEIMMNYE